MQKVWILYITWALPYSGIVYDQTNSEEVYETLETAQSAQAELLRWYKTVEVTQICEERM